MSQHHHPQPYPLATYSHSNTRTTVSRPSYSLSLPTPAVTPPSYNGHQRISHGYHHGQASAQLPSTSSSARSASGSKTMTILESTIPYTSEPPRVSEASFFNAHSAPMPTLNGHAVSQRMGLPPIVAMDNIPPMHEKPSVTSRNTLLNDVRLLPKMPNRHREQFSLFAAEQHHQRDTEANETRSGTAKWQHSVDDDGYRQSKDAIIIDSEDETDGHQIQKHNGAQDPSGKNGRIAAICIQETQRPKRSFREMDLESDPPTTKASSDRLKHLVSPEAIQAAALEEKEEALGKCPKRFSIYNSFLTMKYMHELKEKVSEDESYTASSLSMPTCTNSVSSSPSTVASFSAAAAELDSVMHSKGAIESDLSSFSTSSLTASPQHLGVVTATAALSNKSRIDVASHLGAAEVDALSSFGTITHHPTSQDHPNHHPNHLTRERLKRPPNAYLLFNRAMRRKLLEQSPKMSVAEISKQIGDMWKQLPPDKRQNYVREAASIKQDHLKNHPDFIYTRRSKAQLAEARRCSKSRKHAKMEPMIAVTDAQDPLAPPSLAAEGPTGMVPVSDLAAVLPSTSPNKKRRKNGARDGPRDPRGRKKKRHRHPKAPKHPMSGFLFFLAEVRPNVAKQYPGSTVGPISKVIASQWRNMTDQERQPWLVKAEEDKARYAREMKVYMASLESAQQDNERSSVSGDEEMDGSMVATVAQMINGGSLSFSQQVLDGTGALSDQGPPPSSGTSYTVMPEQFEDEHEIDLSQ